MNDIPLRCVDPIMKYCYSCPWGCTTETSCTTTETFCTLGYDCGRPEDEPTEEEYKEFDEWLKTVYGQAVYK